MSTNKVAKFNEIIPGVKMASKLVERLKERVAVKNEDKILETIETIKYHYQKVEELKNVLQNLTEVL